MPQPSCHVRLVHRDHGPGNRRDHPDHGQEHRHPRQALQRRQVHPDHDPGNRRDHGSGHLHRPDHPVRRDHGPGNRPGRDSGHRHPPVVPGDEAALFRDSGGARQARSALLASPCRCCRRTDYCRGEAPGCGPCPCCRRTDYCRAEVRSGEECPGTVAARRRPRRESERGKPRALMRRMPLAPQQPVPVRQEPTVLPQPVPPAREPVGLERVGLGPVQTALRGWRVPAPPARSPMTPRRAQRFQRAPSPSSWLRPSSPEPRRRALPRAACGRPGLPRSTMPTLRTHRVLEALQGHPCWTHRALSRAHGPEPWTRLSCLWPGLATRALSANDA